MKIVQIIDKLHLAGGQIMCCHLSVELKKMGCDVAVISLYSFQSSLVDYLEENGVKVVFLGKKSGIDLSIIGKLRRAIREEAPDVVHTHLGTFIYYVCAMLGKKTKRCVHTVHSMASREAPGIRGIVAGACFRRRKAVPVALSPEVQRSIAQKYHMALSEIPVVFNGIDLSRCIAKSDYSVHGDFTIIHVGRFCEVKNHVGLVRAFELFHRRHPDSKLCLIGKGKLEQEIKACVETLGIVNAVQFLGSQDNVYPFLNQADIFVLTSFAEGIPMTMIEAMGTALPIVSTAVGGVTDMLENNVNALLCEVNAEQIAECFEKYYLDESLRKKHGIAALDRSKAFSAEEMAKKYLEVYKSL